LVSFYVTFNNSAPGNYTILADATDVDGITEPWNDLGAWSLYAPNTSPTPTFTLSGPTSVSLVAVSPDGGPIVPITVTVISPLNNFTGNVTFSSTTPGIVATGSGGLGNVTVDLQAISGGPTTLTLQGYGGGQSAYITIPVSVSSTQTTVSETIASNPPNLQIMVDSGTCTTPCTFQWVPGSVHNLSAPSPQLLNGAQYTFAYWSDGLAQSHQVTAGSSPYVTAAYNGPPGPAPTLTLLQTGETIAAGGATSFPVYVSQSATTSSTLGVTSWTGGTTPVIRPSAITGPGWVTVIMYGPSVASPTTYNFNVSASATSGYAQAPATLTVNPGGLQPDFILSTTTTPLLLTPSVQTSLFVTIDPVDGYTGTVTFSSSNPALVTVSGSGTPGDPSLTVTLQAGQLAPQTLIVTGKDNAGHVHQLLVNCYPGGGAGAPLTYSAEPQPYGTVVSVPINSSPVSYQISVPGMLESSAPPLLGSMCPIGGTGVWLQVVGVGTYDSVDGIANLTVNFWTLASAAPGVIQYAGCLGLIVPVIAVATPSCSSPTIASLQVNGQNTNSIIEGTVGTITINGTCLRSTASVSVSGAGIAVTPPDPNQPGGWTDSSFTVEYEAAACPPGQGTCATTGTHYLTVAAQVPPAGQPPQGSSDPLVGLKIVVTSITYGPNGAVAYYKDCPTSTPGAGPSGLLPITLPTWALSTAADPSYQSSCTNPNPQNEAVVWVANTTMNAIVYIQSTPAPTQPTPIWVEGTASIPILAGQDTIPPAEAGEPSSGVLVNVAGLSALPKAQTANVQNLITQWMVSGQSSRPDPTTCVTAGTCREINASTNDLYVLLSQPQGETLGEEGTGTGVTRTAIHLATLGTAVDQPSAFTQTWYQFSGSVTDWDKRELVYYNSTTTPQEGLTACVGPNSNTLLTQGIGDSCLWSLLLLEALAMNGIPVQGPSVSYNNPTSSATSFAYACATDGSNLLLKNWQNPSNPSNPSPGYLWRLSLSADGTDPNQPVGMVPAPSGGFGDLTPTSGILGQNSTTPSEKAIGTHHVVVANGGYYDPSYQKSYSSGANIENLIFGYWVPNPNLVDPTQEVVRPPNPEQPNITFSWVAGAHATPTPISPVNLTGQSLTPTLTWSLVPGARSYTVYISGIPSVTISGANITPNSQLQVSYTVPNSLQSDTAYTWAVSSIDCSGTITRSQNANFTTQ